MANRSQFDRIARRLRPRALTWLPLFVIGSVIAHLAALVIFQILYPAPATGLRRSAEVYFLKPASAEAQKLRPWLEAADPALFSRFETGSRALLKRAPLEYVPSFDLMRPHIAALPAEPMIPEEKNYLRASRAPVEGASPTVLTATKIEFSESLRDRAFVADPEFSLAPREGEFPNPLTFSVAVAEDGRPLYVLLEQTSGQTDLDVRARSYLLRGRFEPAKQADAGRVWGRATVIWPQPLSLSAP